MSTYVPRQALTLVESLVPDDLPLETLIVGKLARPQSQHFTVTLRMSAEVQPKQSTTASCVKNAMEMLCHSRDQCEHCILMMSALFNCRV